MSAKIDVSLLPQWLPSFDPGFERCRGCGAERRKPDLFVHENTILIYEEVHEPECPYP